MTIAITGASGLIGRRLLSVLGRRNHTLRALSRRAGVILPPGVALSLWDPREGEPAEAALRGSDAVIHLAGENVAQRWTASAKRRILESRVAGTRALVRSMASLSRPPTALICASAVGYYGSRGNETLTEAAAPGAGFLAEVSMAWEREAQAAQALGVRVVRMRVGVALDPRGGALQRMLLPFRMGLGGPLGDGRQWMSWIHIEDLAELFRFAVETPLEGAVNAVAPNPVENSAFTRELARALRRPALLPAPKFALRALFGEMADALLSSQRAIPQAAVRAGFQFRFPNLAPALADLLW
ncbi:MAG: TIGR01777 family oxidoreductase [Bryobacteraceae bacterium]|jgi:uncharacterized protein (TIGR01777 family)